MAEASEEALPQIDLDALAVAYLHRPASSASLDRARRAGASLPPGSAILDIGGGPGHHARVWREQGHRPVVLDPSAAMCGLAAAPGIAVVRGRSEALPFADGSFALAWFHFSVHYGDWRAAIDEAWRVSVGRIEIWTLSAEHHDRSILAQWFPAIADIDAGRFPDPAAIESYLAAKAPGVERNAVVEPIAKTAGEWAAAVEAGYISSLQYLDEASLSAGLDAFRSAHPDPSDVVQYELRLDQITIRR